MWDHSHPRWLLFAGEVMVRAAEIRERDEARMSVQIKGLADIVRQAKAAIDTASGAAGGMADAANRVAGRIAQVNEMTKQLEDADAELQAAIGEMTNGGPPLEATTGSTQPVPDSAPPVTSAADLAPVAVAPAPAAAVVNGPINTSPSLQHARMQVEVQNASKMPNPATIADKYIPRK